MKHLRNLGVSDLTGICYQLLKIFKSHLVWRLRFQHLPRRLAVLSVSPHRRGREAFRRVAATYRKREAEIARGIAKNDMGATLTNAKMEAGNDVAQTMIDAAYGYRNFERFRECFLPMR